MNEGVRIKLADHTGGQPEFRCIIHDAIMLEDKSLLHFFCTEEMCNQTLSFNQIQEIAKRLRGYA